MEFLTESLRVLHIIAGFISLVFFWIPVFTKKGGKTHRQVGKIYIRLMWIVVSTAAILSIVNLYTGRVHMGVFLGFLSLITANPLWHGIAILRQKKQIGSSYKSVFLVFNVIIVLCSIGLISYGIVLQGRGSAILMFIFGALGLTGISDIVKALKQPAEKTEWLKVHIVGMFTSGIAAYTAFFVFGANQFFSILLPGLWAVIPWIAPSIIGTIGIRYQLKKLNV